jgi:hypothetical protein
MVLVKNEAKNGQELNKRQYWVKISYSVKVV